MSQSSVKIALAESEHDISQGFQCAAEAFGRQTGDAIWIGMNPGWDTAEGSAAGAARMVDRWKSVTRDRDGNLNTMFVKATLPVDEASNDDNGSGNDNGDGNQKVVGMAIWVQMSSRPGHGESPPDQDQFMADAAAIYPDNPSEQRYMAQVIGLMQKQRIEAVKAKAETDQPAAMVLDLCIVNPAYQGRGIARQMVQWGLDEAKRRSSSSHSGHGDHGGLGPRPMEALLEASTMGRRVYAKMGFVREGPEIDYAVDDEFRSKSVQLPSNIFMRRQG